MAEITVNDLTISFEQDRRILDGISFRIDRGEHVAILGGNGCGKTTLLRLLTGELTPDQGSISVSRGARIGYVRQMNTEMNAGTVEEVLKSAYSDVIGSARELEQMHGSMENVSAARYDAALRRFEAAGGYNWESEYLRIAGGLNIDADMRARRFDTLSGGEQTRVNLAKMIMERPDILLLDEPTNHLDMQSLEWLEDHLQHFKGTVIMVSHDRYFLDATAQRVIEIFRGKMSFYSGNYSFYVKERELRYQQQLEMYNREQSKAKQLEFQIARLKAWGSVYDNPALHKKAAAMEKRVERIQQTDRPVRDEKLRQGFASEKMRADFVLRAEHLVKRFDGRMVISDLSLSIRGNGERVALIGPNGTGKSTLIQLLLGLLVPDGGVVRMGPSVKTAYLPQKVEFAHPERTLYDTLLYETACSPQEARDRLGAFRFSQEDQFKLVSQLSGGERSRLMMCIIMLSRANFLVLDEPTNHLDIDSSEWIEEAVEAFEGTLLFVSHDRYFVRRFANHIWLLGDHTFTDYPDCDWERFLSIRQMERIREESEKRSGKKEKEQKRAPEPVRESAGQNENAPRKNRDAKQLRRMDALEREIARKEEFLLSYDEKMEAVATDYEKLQQLEAEKQALQEEIDGMYLAWEELAGS